MIAADAPARLSVSLGSGLTVEVRLGIRETRIGRGKASDLLLPDPAVSRLHARIFRVGDQFFLADASRNGTFAGGKRVTQLLLEDGTVFRIGPYLIHFHRPGSDCPEPVTAADDGGAEPRAGSRPQAPPPPSRPPTFGIAGESPAIRRLIEDIRKVAAADIPVLVEGETGSGKELVCRGIHDASPRGGRPFVVVNCGAISPDLVESELFGHEKGSFTGATAQRRGAFEVAHGGTIFLDEIGELPLALQPKLLRALEQKEIKRVGGNETINVDVRVLAATNRDLREEMARRTFRDDLYFRLSAVSLRVPPLRERREDIVPLTLRFLEETSVREGRPVPGLAPSAASFLAASDWPGNVRELRNAVQRAVVMAGKPCLDAEDFTFLLPASPRESAEIHDPGLSRWEQSEKHNLLAELARQGWNKTRTARALGIAKSTLFEKLKKFGIRRPETGL